MRSFYQDRLQTKIGKTQKGRLSQVISNSFIIGFTSDAAYKLFVDSEEESSIDERYNQYKLWACVIVAEHLMLGGKLLIELSFAKVPNRVTNSTHAHSLTHSRARML
jgi:hypothetical protein